MYRQGALVRGKAENHGDFSYILNRNVQLRQSPARSLFQQSGLPLTDRLHVSGRSLEIASEAAPRCILRQEPFPVLADDVVDHFVRDLREICPSDNVVHLVLTGDHLGRSGRGKSDPKMSLCSTPYSMAVMNA